MKRNKILLIVIVLWGTALLSKAYQHRESGLLKLSKAGHAVADLPDTTRQYNEDLFKQFESVCREMDSHDKIAISGTLFMQDKADSLSKPQTLPLILCREGKELYYKLGNTEMLSSNEYYVFTDHDAKKVMFSETAQLITSNVIDTRRMKEALLSEEYELKSKSQGLNTTISLINENHITCKEYSITFDTATLSAKKFYMRFSNANDPLGKDNEKIIELTVIQREDSPDISKYLNERIPLSGDGTDLKLKKEYADYELIKL